MKIGIIGGTGLDNPNLLENFEEKDVDTPYGKPSSKIICGKLNGVDVCILARHGKGHIIPPTQVNFRANIFALQSLGCTQIIATTASGSLKEEIKPTDLVFPNQFIDFTKQREMSFFDKPGEVVHTSMPEPYNKEMRDLLCKICDEFGFKYHTNKTSFAIEGPRFSTKAESNMFRQWGADIINMSSCPETALANELKIPYQIIAMPVDYDCWKENEEPVTWDMIQKRMSDNADKVKKVLLRFIEKFGNQDIEFIKSKIKSIPRWPKEHVIFRDVTSVWRDKEGFNRLIETLYDRYKNMKIDSIAGIDARGFVMGSILAYKLGIGFIPIRKKGKLPPETISEEYITEYSVDKIEISKDCINQGDKILIVDDLIATGGTALAACNLVKKLGAEIVEFSAIVNLPALGGKKKLEDAGFKVFNLVEFEGD